MASRKSPLRDRLLSNSPDPIKSSILRESGMGWSASTTSNPVAASGSAGSITSPLRISKRDSPSARPKGPAVARRTSSSYRHVHKNNLVSNSPFKSQIPTPSTPSSRTSVLFPTRRVSGEKRPRPSSMHELGETENDRPFAAKRERKQSKTFQGLLEKEPVSKSPFKIQQNGLPAKPTTPPPVPLTHVQPQQRSFTPPPPTTLAQPVASPNSGPSPGRSSLVSRRMHGPRLSGGTKRERRKTVTFHERCDVLEFDREDTEEEVFESADEESHVNDDDGGSNQELHREDNPPSIPSQPINDNDEVMEDDPSYESIQLSDTGINPSAPSLLSDPDASITGIVEEMFFSSNAANLFTEVSMTSNASTPPRHCDIPTDLETEDGVPFGRTHHVDRFLQHHQHHSHNVQPPPHFSSLGSSPAHQTSPHHTSPSVYSQAFHLPTHASPLGPPATPPRRSPAIRHSTPPLGRSTHFERIRQAREEEEKEEDEADDVDRLPISPSPMKRKTSTTNLLNEGLIPRFDLKSRNEVDSELTRSASMSIDPFTPLLQDESILSGLEQPDAIDSKDDSTDTVNVSIGNSEVNLSALASERNTEEVLCGLEATPEPRSVSSPSHNPLKSPPMSEYHSGFSKCVMSPGSRSASPLLSSGSGTQPLAKTSSRERISREEVQRRLMNQRSPGSPGGSDNDFRSSLLRNKPSLSIEHIGSPSDSVTRRSPFSLTADKQQDRLSVLTTQTDFSTETAIVEVVQKKNLGLTSLSGSTKEDDSEFGMLNPGHKLQFDFGSKFSIGGLSLPKMSVDEDNAQIPAESCTTLATPASQPRKAASFEINTSGIKMGDVDVDMDMKSALDRLMEDVAGAGAHPDDSMMTDEYDESFERPPSHDNHIASGNSPSSRPKIMERPATDSVYLQENEMDGIMSRSVSGASTTALPPPPVPPKDNIRNREQIILEKRREARRLEEAADQFQHHKAQKNLGVGRPSRRRSLSTSDAEVLGGGAKKRGDALLDLSTEPVIDRPLSDSIEQELQKLVREQQKSVSKYHVREHVGTIYASSSDEKVAHMAGPGDVNPGRAWRTVRRPSDMNEYAKQIREYRAQDKGKAYGKVFVKVLGVRGMTLPLPGEPTVVTCTLNNGIHFVTTPECQLSPDCRINQEFELIEHSKLEFTLTLKVRRDPHIITQFKALTPSVPPVVVAPRVPVAILPAKSHGMRSFFSSSPKKSSKEKIVTQPPQAIQSQPPPLHRLPENLARHLKPDGTLARAFISFKDIASRCDTRLFETCYPLIGQRIELGGKFSTLEVGEIVLQLFRLPPLPGVPQDQLPQSLEECHRGLRHINWHKVTYFQGTLTQNGGDCSTWRRRQLRVIGSNLVAFNDVTKKATATIDLKKAVAVEDDQEARRYADEYDGLCGVERSFRLIFPEDQEIIFFADTDEEKYRWCVLEVLRALVGRIPPHPLWAELLWQRQDEITKRMAAAQQSLAQTSPDVLRPLQQR
ncbi:hypothetical protein BDN70DRAFT_986033 [Pholiota conissans]|uniref:PH domain-containing protein n=1 Tax=Pholiota conissans TaxID=109636 RepID=A0A9P5Z0Z4_9AGAR|nr:hypothetical protein BDN70DRAFT_986033 [Pholiota conissans]